MTEAASSSTPSSSSSPPSEAGSLVEAKAAAAEAKAAAIEAKAAAIEAKAAAIEAKAATTDAKVATTEAKAAATEAKAPQAEPAAKVSPPKEPDGLDDMMEIEPGPEGPPPVPSRKTSEHPAPMSVTATAARVWPPTVVGDIMTRKVIAIKEHEPIGDLEATMERFHFHHLPVVTDDMKLVGLITRSDYLHSMLGRAIDGVPAPTLDAKTPASAIMRKNVVTGTADAPLATACQVMVSSELSCFPIILEDRTLVGILTQADFVKLVLEFLQL